MAATIRDASGTVDTTKAKWGTSQATPAAWAYGKIVSCSTKNTAKIVEEMDGEGDLHAWIAYDQRAEVDVEILCNSDDEAPAIGSKIEVGGVADLLVKECTVKWTAGATKKLTITAWKSVA